MFSHLFEAAIVFARSVTFHLQKQYAHTAGFDDWYSRCQDQLRQDPLAFFFIHQRNFVLHQGSVPMSKHVNVMLRSSVVATSSVSVKVIRGRPWYRRSPRILMEDAIYPVRARLHDWRKRRRQRRRIREAKQQSGTTVTETIRFQEEPWAQRPALELLREYLGTLEGIVADAEAQFGLGDTEAA